MIYLTVDRLQQFFDILSIQICINDILYTC